MNEQNTDQPAPEQDSASDRPASEQFYTLFAALFDEVRRLVREEVQQLLTEPLSATDFDALYARIVARSRSDFRDLAVAGGSAAGQTEASDYSAHTSTPPPHP